MTAVYLDQIASLARQARTQQELTKAYLSRIGALIHEAREQQDLSCAELACALGTDPGEVVRIERDGQDVSPELLDRLGLALDAASESGTAEFGAPGPCLGPDDEGL